MGALDDGSLKKRPQVATLAGVLGCPPHPTTAPLPLRNQKTWLQTPGLFSCVANIPYESQ